MWQWSAQDKDLHISTTADYCVAAEALCVGLPYLLHV